MTALVGMDHPVPAGEQLFVEWATPPLPWLPCSVPASCPACRHVLASMSPCPQDSLLNPKCMCPCPPQNSALALYHSACKGCPLAFHPPMAFLAVTSQHSLQSGTTGRPPCLSSSQDSPSVPRGPQLLTLPTPFSQSCHHNPSHLSLFPGVPLNPLRAKHMGLEWTCLCVHLAFYSCRASREPRVQQGRGPRRRLQASLQGVGGAEASQGKPSRLGLLSVVLFVGVVRPWLHASSSSGLESSFVAEWLRGFCYLCGSVPLSEDGDDCRLYLLEL